MVFISTSPQPPKHREWPSLALRVPCRIDSALGFCGVSAAASVGLGIWGWRGAEVQYNGVGHVMEETDWV